MKFRYYTNDAADVVSGIYDVSAPVSAEEALYADDPECHRVVVEVRRHSEPFVAGYCVGIQDLIRFGVLENDSALTVHLLRVGFME